MSITKCELCHPGVTCFIHLMKRTCQKWKQQHFTIKCTCFMNLKYFLFQTAALKRWSGKQRNFHIMILDQVSVNWNSNASRAESYIFWLQAKGTFRKLQQLRESFFHRSRLTNLGQRECWYPLSITSILLYFNQNNPLLVGCFHSLTTGLWSNLPQNQFPWEIEESRKIW